MRLAALLALTAVAGLLIAGQAAAPAYSECSDSLDQDRDGLVDLDDPDCADLADEIEGRLTAVRDRAHAASGLDGLLSGPQAQRPLSSPRSRALSFLPTRAVGLSRPGRAGGLGWDRRLDGRRGGAVPIQLVPGTLRRARTGSPVRDPGSQRALHDGTPADPRLVFACSVARSLQLLAAIHPCDGAV
jgi:hypothetical protein